MLVKRRKNIYYFWFATIFIETCNLKTYLFIFSLLKPVLYKGILFTLRVNDTNNTNKGLN